MTKAQLIEKIISTIGLSFTVIHKGEKIEARTVEWVEENCGKDVVTVLESAVTLFEGDVVRSKIRNTIEKNVGDQASILGTTADVTQLNAAAILALIAAFKSGDTFPKFRAQFMGIIEALVPPTEDGADVYAQAGQFLAGVQSGDIILTAALKGLTAVINDMATRSTGVAQVLMAAASDKAAE